LRHWDARVLGFQLPEAELRETWEADARGRPQRPRDFSAGQIKLLVPVVLNGTRYSRILSPALMVFASPHLAAGLVSELAPEKRSAMSAYLTALDAAAEKQAKAIEAALPEVRVVRLKSSRYVFLTNEREMLREVRTFLGRVK
jgi:hypothetical protein